MATVRNASHADVPPLTADGCKTLILGSMLSPKSAQAAFYYAHPQNRFWRVMHALLGSGPFPETNAERARLVTSRGIALWDVIASCKISGAADSTIKDVEFNDIAGFIAANGITKVFTTGKTAYALLQKYNRAADNAVISQATALPSTSPLNCAVSLDRLISAYSVILDYVK